MIPKLSHSPLIVSRLVFSQTVVIHIPHSPVPCLHAAYDTAYLQVSNSICLLIYIFKKNIFEATINGRKRYYLLQLEGKYKL